MKEINNKESLSSRWFFHKCMALVALVTDIVSKLVNTLEGFYYALVIPNHLVIIRDSQTSPARPSGMAESRGKSPLFSSLRGCLRGDMPFPHK